MQKVLRIPTKQTDWLIHLVIIEKLSNRRYQCLLIRKGLFNLLFKPNNIATVKPLPSSLPQLVKPRLPVVRRICHLFRVNLLRHRMARLQPLITNLVLFTVNDYLITLSGNVVVLVADVASDVDWRIVAISDFFGNGCEFVLFIWDFV
jgi:hypothetical protein